MSDTRTPLLEVTVADGKYTVRQEADGRINVLRHGLPWLDNTGNKLVLALAQEVETLRTELSDTRTPSTAHRA